MLLADSLRYQASLRGAQTAIVDESRDWTFTTLLADATRVMSRLNTWSPTKRRIALLCSNKGEHLVALFGVAATLHEVVMLDPKWSQTELKKAIEIFSPDLLLIDGDDARVDELSEHLETMVLQSALETEGGVAGESDRSKVVVGEGFRARAARDDVFAIAPSGGTSGKLKGAAISHGATVSRFLTQLVEFGIEPGDRFLVCTPLFHGSARSHALSHLYFGASVRILDKFDPIKFQQYAGETTATFCVPTMLNQIAKLESVKNPNLAVIAGGAAISSVLENLIADRVTPRFYNYYAAVESGPIAIKRPQDNGADESAPAGFVGRAVFGAHVTIVDADEHGVGKVQIQADFLSSAIEGDVDEEVARQLADEGVYQTGDLGSLDDSGRLYLHGRADDVVISGGINIHPREVEAVIRGTFDVDEVVVLGIPDLRWGEKLVAIIAAPTKHRMTYDLAKSMLVDHLSRVKIPKEIYWIDEMPITSMGKINTHQLRTHAQNQVKK